MPTNDIIDYDPTASNNTSVDGISIAEQCDPGNLNNAQRAVMAALARMIFSLTGEKETGGTADAQTLTTGLQWSAYSENILAFTAGSGLTNTGAATLNVDSIGAKAVVRNGDVALSAGDITAGGVYLVVYESTLDKFVLLNPNAYYTFLDEDTMSSDSATAVASQQSIKAYADTKLALTGGTLSGEVNLADNLLTRPKIKDYGESVSAHGNSGSGTEDFDLSVANVHTVTITAGTVNVTFSNPPASGTAGSLTIIMTNGGSQTVNWPAAVDWAGGSAPSLTSSGVDILTFLTTNGGTTWYGFPAGLSMS